MNKQIRSFIVGGFLVGGLLSFVASSASAEAAPKKDWTMLVFINGHNNLDSYGKYNINQMEKVGSTDKLNVVVQWASLAAPTTKRLIVQKDNDTSKVTSPIVQDLPRVDMGDKNELLNFIKWGHDNYPADHYFVVVWNHGSGWRLYNKRGLTDGIQIQDISSDDKTGNIITTEELGQVMKDAAAYVGHKIDIYGSDACLMSMIEIAQEMEGAVNTFVGSQELEPGDGWPYDYFLTAWEKNPHASPNEVGVMLTEAYDRYYKEQNDDSVTFSTIDVNELGELNKRLSILKDDLIASGALATVQTSALKATRFYYRDYVDLGDLLSRIGSGNPGVASASIDSVKQQLGKVVVINRTKMYADGLSIWWPTTSYTFKAYGKRYTGLNFDKTTGWSSLFSAIYP